MKFEYIPKELAIEAYGKVFSLPKKTPGVLNRIANVQKSMAAADASAQTSAILEGIGIFIGDENTKEIFPILEEIDTDELSAFWFTLTGIYNQAARSIVQEYTANRAERKG